MKTMKEEKGSKNAKSVQEKKNKKGQGISTQKSGPNTGSGKNKISKEYDRAENETFDSTDKLQKSKKRNN